MAKIQWRISELPYRLLDKLHIGNFFHWISLLSKTLCYNFFTSWTVALETGLEPLFCSLERFSKYLGPVFTSLVVVLTTSVVVIFYICLLPHVYDQSLSKTIFHLVFGHWLLINIVFNYFMAAFTNPGNPPREVPETVSICKKCIAPKPPRAHHCSVCDKCILKMDHHCRVDLFKQHFYGTKEYPFPAVLYPLNLVYDAIYGSKGNYATNMAFDAVKAGVPGHTTPHAEVLEVDYREQRYHNAVIYEFVICSAVALALGVLVIWHVKMISTAETNIEIHINRKERERLKKVGLIFRNPYHYGFIQNWRVFFSLTEGSFIPDGESEDYIADIGCRNGTIEWHYPHSFIRVHFRRTLPTFKVCFTDGLVGQQFNLTDVTNGLRHRLPNVDTGMYWFCVLTLYSK
ncbi:hypothetical protein FSP39_011170 [Pinctada imbricata]|uniref:Palmitoyltransferase n=1 Tax=Pinctada imbricata TaxID=66713 RepID=A0AA88YA15_PINIB|nr:hypothetical protein FSP39_011170 [Pinctada imbricata]